MINYFSDIVLSANERQDSGKGSHEIREHLDIPDQLPEESYDPDNLVGALNEAELFDYVDEPVAEKKKTKRKNAQQTEVKWTETEEIEIQQLFKKYFENKIRPKPDFCAIAIRLSKAKGICIFKRKTYVLQKVFSDD